MSRSAGAKIARRDHREMSSAPPETGTQPISRRHAIVDRLTRHLPELLRLAAPVVVARLGIMGMQLVDTVMVGRFDSQELAFQAIALVPFQFLVVATLGLLIGTVAVAAQAFGREDYVECGGAWRRSIPYAVVIGLAGLVLCQMGEGFLRLSGQTETLSSHGGRVVAILGFGLPFYLIYLTTAFFLEGIKRPLPAMIVMIAANVLNVALNWILIYGHLGFPAMGAEGSAWATTILRVVMVAALVGYVWFMSDHHRFAVRRRPSGGWRAGALQRRIGYSSGLSYTAESGSFAIVGLMAGWTGELPLAAFSITLNVVAIVFMVALGFGSATAVRVAVAYGRQDRPDTAFAGWSGLAVNSLVMALLGLGMWLGADLIAAAYTTDPMTLLLTAPLIAFAATIVVADGGQTVMLHALRGRGETWVPTILHMISYFVVQVPIAYGLAFTLDRGVRGLFEGILVASIVAILLLSVRFHWLTRAHRIG